MKYHFLLLFLTLRVILYCQIPVVTSISPTSGPINTLLTISGSNFSTTPANNIVYFDGVRATVQNSTATSLQVTVPAGITSSAKITILSGGYLRESPKRFKVTFDDGNWTSFSSSNFTKISIPTSQPAPTFNTISSWVWWPGPQMIATGDLDCDGDLDVIQPFHPGYAIKISSNTSTINAVSFSLGGTNLTTSNNPVAMEVGDINNDGKLDIIVLTNNQEIDVFLNMNTTPGTMSFSTKHTFSSSSRDRFLLFDVDNDGKLDIVGVNPTNGNQIKILQNTTTALGSTPTFNHMMSLTLGSWSSMSNPIINFSSGDMDNDGYMDLVHIRGNSTGSSAAISSEVSILSGGTNGILSFSYGQLFNMGCSISPINQNPIKIDDFNNDGILDIVNRFDLNNLNIAFKSSPSSSYTQSGTSISNDWDSPSINTADLIGERVVVVFFLA